MIVTVGGEDETLWEGGLCLGKAFKPLHDNIRGIKVAITRI